MTKKSQLFKEDVQCFFSYKHQTYIFINLYIINNEDSYFSK